MSTEDLFERALAALHRAALDDAHWLSAAALINEACATKGHAVFLGKGYSPRELEPFLFRVWAGQHRRDDWEATYLRDYAYRDERIRPGTRLPDGKVVHTHALFTEGEREASPVYNELMREMGAQNGLNVRMDGPGGSHVMWATADSAEDRSWSSDQVRMVERLRPHIRQFVCVRHALVEAGALGVSLSGLLDNTRACVIQLDRRGKIVEANDAARDHLRRHEVLFAPGGFLRATGIEENAELQRLLVRAMPPFGGQGTGGSMAIRGTSRSSAWVVHVHPIAAGLTDYRTRRVAALVLAVSPASPVWIDPDLVASALELTPTESRLAAALAAGHSVADIAAATQRKEGTIHWHLNQIFRKQNITRQVELVRRVLSLQPLSERRARDQDPPGGLN